MTLFSASIVTVSSVAIATTAGSITNNDTNFTVIGEIDKLRYE